MNDEIFVVRCARCLLSISCDNPRETADRIVAHRCDGEDLGWQELQREIAALVEQLHQRKRITKRREQS